MNVTILTPDGGRLTPDGGRYPAEEMAGFLHLTGGLGNGRARCALPGFLAAFVLAMGLMGFQAKPAAAADCTDSLQAKVDAAPSGGTVTANACTYREDVEITKPLILKGQPGSEIRGSDVWGPKQWTSFVSGGVTYWRSNAGVGPFYQENVPCEPGTKDCAYPEQVFKNGAEMKQVYSLPASGQFQAEAPDAQGKRKVVVRDNPASFTLEVTTRKHWVTGTGTANNVTIQGFTMKHAANEMRSGAIMSRQPTTGSPGAISWSRIKQDGNDWNVLDNNLSYAHGAVLSVRGDNGNIERNDISYGGQLGIHNAGTGALVKNNTIHRNNWQSFCYKDPQNCDYYDTDTNGRAAATSGNVTTEAGGAKIAGGQTGVTVDANEVYENRGNGVWFDVDASYATVSNNTIHHNGRRGIFYEISDYSKIFSNVVYENGWDTPTWVDGAGIQIGNSSDVEVYDNTLAWNADGIAVISLDRNGTDHDDVKNVKVHDNRIAQSDLPRITGDGATMALGFLQGWKAQIDTAAAGNQATNNKVFYPESEGTYNRFSCRTSYKTMTQFNSSACATGVSYATPTEKNAWVTKYGVPANQDPR